MVSVPFHNSLAAQKDSSLVYRRSSRIKKPIDYNSLNRVEIVSMAQNLPNIPDFDGSIGYKFFVVGGGDGKTLIGGAGNEWNSETYIADCDGSKKRAANHLVRESSCSCGIYTWAKLCLIEAPYFIPQAGVMAEVRNYGTVWKHTHGAKSQTSVITQLWVFDEHLLYSLSEKYKNVPILQISELEFDKLMVESLLDLGVRYYDEPNIPILLARGKV